MPWVKFPHAKNTKPLAPCVCIAMSVQPLTAVALTIGDHDAPPSMERKKPARVVANSRWLLRATNDGITSIIDPAGRVVASLPSFEKGVLCGKFNYRTELTWFARFGEWFWWLCCVATCALFAVDRLRRIAR